MSNIGGGEIIAILFLALLVLGPDRLPTAARQVGKVLRQLRGLSSGFQEEIRSAMQDPQPTSIRTEVESERRRLAAVPDEPPVPELESEVIARAEPGDGHAPDTQGVASEATSDDDEQATG